MRKLRYLGFLNEHSGFGESARSHVSALANAGIPLTIQPAGLSPRGPVLYDADIETFPELDDLPVGEKDYDIEIIHTMPLSFPCFQTSGVHSIGLTVSDTESLPDSWHEPVESMGEIWLPSEFAAATFRSACNIPVHVVPHPVKPRKVSRSALPDIPDDVFLFLAIFEWQDRKNPDGLIRAFIAAFRGRGDVALLLKIGAMFCGGRNVVDRALNELTGSLVPRRGPRIYVVQEKLSALTMERLYQRADAYVSLHRAEAFGLCMAEAMAVSTPVIATAYGGNLEFMDVQSSFLVAYDMVPVHERYARAHPYDSKMYWAQPRFDDTVDALRTCVDQPTLRSEKAIRGHQKVADALDPAIIGQLMKERLSEL